MTFIQNTIVLLLAAAGGGFFAAIVTWLLLRQNEMRDLLSEMLAVQALVEAWVLEGPETDVYKAKLSGIVLSQKQLPTSPNDNHLWLRPVEVRAVLDAFKWSSPLNQCYGFFEYRRVWIVRDCPAVQCVYPGGGIAQYGPPALLSSRGFEELVCWIERVASAYPLYRPFRMLSPRGLKMLRPLLAAISSPDRIDVFRDRLTPQAKQFLKWYYQRDVCMKKLTRRERLLQAWWDTPCPQLLNAIMRAWKG